MAEKSVVSNAQPSLTEWFAAIGHAKKAELQAEDIKKRDRLAVLSDLIGLDYDHVWTFEAEDVWARASHTEAFFAKHADDLCAIRLVPKDPSLPKLRTRGRSVVASLSWLFEQTVRPADYRVEVVEHSDVAEYSTIFVVRNDGIFGQVVSGLHHQLTQGDVKGDSWTFQLSPSGEWQWSEHDSGVEAHVKNVLASILVDKEEMRARLHDELKTEFASSGHMLGYFETLLWPNRLIFIDYNRLLHNMLPAFAPISDRGEEGALRGQCASAGSLEGVACLVESDDVELATVPEGGILLTKNTDVRFLPLMQGARAVLTEQGGILSHAAIVCRELRIPCVVGIKGLLDRVKNGDRLSVHAESGIVEVL